MTRRKLFVFLKLLGNEKKVNDAIERLIHDQQHKHCDLADLDLAQLQQLHPDITQRVFDVLTVQASVASRKSYGGTAPDNVRQQVMAWRQKLS